MDTNFYAARMAALETQNLYWAFACLFLVIAAFCALYWQQLRIQSLQEENADHIAVIEAHTLEAAALRERADQLQANGLVLARYFVEHQEPEQRPEKLNNALVRTMGQAMKTRSISLNEWRTDAPGIKRELSADEQFAEACNCG